MSENSHDNDSFQALSEEEKRLLAKSLKELEDRLFHKVLARFRNYLLATLGILTVGGIVTFAGMRSSIESIVASKLYNDPAIQERVVQKSLSQLEDVEKVIERAKTLTKEIELAQMEANLIVEDNLDTVRVRVEQLLHDLQELRTELRRNKLLHVDLYCMHDASFCS